MALPATDAFTGTTNDQLTTYSANWTLRDGDFDIQTNQVAPDDPAADECCAYWNADVFNSNHYAKITPNAYANGLIGVATRIQSGANSYYGVYSGAAASYSFDVDAGAWTQRFADASIATGTVLELRSNGDAHDVYEDDVLNSTLSFTDAGGLSGGAAGICGYNDDAGCLADSWEGGDIGAATASIDTIDSPVLDAEANNAFTVSNYGSAINSFTIEDVENGSHQIDLSASLAGTYTFDMPDVSAYTSDTLGTPFDSTYWSHTATAGDGVDTDTETIVVNPKSGWARVDTATTPDVASGSVYENFTGFFDAVSAVSEANPSQLTLADTSAWVDGQEVTLAGFNTTPDINGTQIITVVDGTHVSIPVNVTAVTDGVGTMLTGAASEHGQVYYSTSNNTSVVADGTLTTDKTSGTLSMQYFDTVDSKWKPFTITISAAGVTPIGGSNIAKLMRKRRRR